MPSPILERTFKAMKRIPTPRRADPWVGLRPGQAPALHLLLMLLALTAVRGLGQAQQHAEPEVMQKDEQGVWSVTTVPLEADFYGYSFVADGVSLIDPSNPLMKPNLLHTESEVHVPGPASLPWETSDTPHGVIHHHFYRSGIVGDDRDFYVYTPPGYDPLAKQTYPVLYLLHGFSDDGTGQGKS